MYVLKKYGVTTKIVFPLIDFGATDYEGTPVTIATGDCKIMKNEGAWANTDNDFVDEGEGYYSVVLTATEMEFATGVVKIVDQTGTKEWDDQSIVIDTYGHASAEHEVFPSNVKQVSDDATAADNLELFTEVLENGTGLIDAGTFKAGAIDNSAIAAGAITSTEATSVGTATLADGAHGGSSAVLTLDQLITLGAGGAGVILGGVGNTALQVGPLSGNGTGIDIFGSGTGRAIEVAQGGTATSTIRMRNTVNGGYVISKESTGGAGDNSVENWETAGVGNCWVFLTDGGTPEFYSAQEVAIGSDGKFVLSTDAQDLSASLDVNVGAISGDSAAADRLELFSEYQSYQDRSIHVDTVSGAAGTTDHENGTLLNPSSVWADALTLAASLNLGGFHMHPASSITLTEDHANNVFRGESWTIATAGYDLSNSYVYDAFVNGGESTSDTQNANFTRCLIWSHTAGSAVFRQCAIANDFTLGESSGSYTLVDCFEASGQTQASIDFNSLGNTQVQMDRFSGVIELKNMAAGDVLNFYGNGGIIINANCAGGTINRMAGNFDVTDNANGNVTVTNEVARFDTVDVADAVWDETEAEQTAVPAANASFRDKLNWMFKRMRNKFTQTASTATLMADDGSTPDNTSAVSDDNTTATRDEWT